MYMIDFRPFHSPVPSLTTPSLPSTFRCHCMRTDGRLLAWDQVLVATSLKKTTLIPQQPYSSIQMSLLGSVETLGHFEHFTPTVHPSKGKEGKAQGILSVLSLHCWEELQTGLHHKGVAGHDPHHTQPLRAMRLSCLHLLCLVKNSRFIPS